MIPEDEEHGTDARATSDGGSPSIAADEDDDWEPPLGILPANRPADLDGTQELDLEEDELEYVDDPAVQLVELQSTLPTPRHSASPATVADPNITEGMVADIRNSSRITNQCIRTKCDPGAACTVGDVPVHLRRRGYWR